MNETVPKFNKINVVTNGYYEGENASIINPMHEEYKDLNPGMNVVIFFNMTHCEKRTNLSWTLLDSFQWLPFTIGNRKECPWIISWCICLHTTTWQVARYWHSLWNECLIVQIFTSTEKVLLLMFKAWIYVGTFRAP